MSFILDALRKSDAERQRTTAPGLTDVRYARRQQRRNRWLPIVGGLILLMLAANLLVMAGRWLAPGSDDSAAATSALPVPPTSDIDNANIGAPVTEIRPLAREAENRDAEYGEPSAASPFDSEFGEPPVTTEDDSVGISDRDRQQPTVANNAQAPTGQSATQNAAPESVASAPPNPGSSTPTMPSRILKGNDLPSADELVGTGALNVAALNLDLHVYSDKPASRFVIINGQKYREGAKLADGPTVESITKDGVVLASQGRRFVLSRK